MAMFLLAGKSEAQNFGACTDSTKPAQPTYSCPADYAPVCGCNGKTYRNSCIATYRNGLQYYSDGCCGYFDYDITPPTNQISETLPLKIYSKTSGIMILTIYDPFGNRKIEFPLEINSADQLGGVPQSFDVDVSSLSTGVYLLQLSNSIDKQVKRFFKVKLY
jgi:hypothetical protein